MTEDTIIDDINYIKSIAEGGEQTPLIGGRIGLMWGVLIAIVFTVQWAILSQTLNIPAQNLLYVWIAFIVIGSLGCMVLGKNMSSMAGANSVANRADNYVWVMFSAMMMTLFVGIILKMVLSDGTPALFDLMLPVGFAGQGLAYGLVAKLSKFKWLQMVALVNFIVSAICFVAYGDVHIYLIGAVGIVLTVVIPSLITIKNEPKHVI